jgi:transcriptional regulator with XRE-family HTH domain
MKFCERLKYARGDISQLKMAQLLGMKPSAYGHYETGRSEPSLDVLLKIVGITRKSPFWLLGIESEGSRIRKEREAKGMTVCDLSEKVKVTKERIESMENDHSSADDMEILKLSRVLDVSVAYLRCHDLLYAGKHFMRTAPPEPDTPTPVPCPNCERLMAMLEQQGRIIENLSKGKK